MAVDFYILAYAVDAPEAVQEATAITTHIREFARVIAMNMQRPVQRASEFQRVQLKIDG